MSLVLALPFGVASAVVYGTSIVVQHRVAQQSAAEEGEPTAAGLMRLIRHPIFLLAIAGDVVGFALQITALSLGAVVVIQPLVVLMLPVSLAVGFAWGGPRPRFGDYLGVLGVLGGLAVFLALIGRPGPEFVPRPRYIGMAIGIVLLAGLALTILATGFDRVVRGAAYGVVAGACFGTLAVLVDAVSERWSEHGLNGVLSSPRGMVPIVGILLLGTGGIVLTQMSFQVGALGATLPASLAADPFMGVLLGAALLRERIPLSVPHLIAYVACLVAVVAGAIRLADPDHGGGGPCAADTPPPQPAQHEPAGEGQPRGR